MTASIAVSPRSRASTPPEPERAHEPSGAVTGLVRALDVVAVVCTVLALAVLAVGTVGVAPLTLSRAEDLVVVVALVVAARVVFAPIRLPPVPPRVLLVGGVTLYLVLMGTIVVTRHLAFRTHALDLGYYVQLVWNLAHAHGARVTLPAMHAWGDHFSPVLYLFIPLGWLVPGAVSLVLAQTAILAAGALGVYAFTHRRLGDARVAAGMAGLYLLNPTLHGINVRDVHPAAFAVPLVVTAALAFDSRRPVWCAAALMLALASREDAAVAGVGFAVWLPPPPPPRGGGAGGGPGGGGRPPRPRPPPPPPPSRAGGSPP